MISLEQAGRATNQFMDEFMIDKNGSVFKEFWGDYIQSFGMKLVNRCFKNISDDEKKDWCIHVCLQKNLPPDLKLPDKFMGVRVYAEITGKLEYH